ncbi:hypothetical protein J6O48_10580 [bacterium]|nr:hypothetical protein [bacterium]
MIDKENEVFTRVKEAILAVYPKAKVDSSYQPNPSGFPHVSLYQSDSFTPRAQLDSSTLPKFASFTFEAQVYSNDKNVKKQVCKEIMGIISDKMAEMNLTRIICTPVMNLNDASIYRLTARFEGMADANGFYRR